MSSSKRSTKRSAADGSKVRTKDSAAGAGATIAAVAKRPDVPLAIRMRPYGAAILAGTLYFLGFAGFDLWPLCFVALVPLLWALDAEAPIGSWRALRIGLLFGLVTNLGGYYWLVPTLEVFSGFSAIIAAPIAMILCAYQGGLLAFFTVLYNRARQNGWDPMLAAPFIFAAGEMVYPLLFESYFGNSLHGTPALIQIADLGGPILVTVLAVSVNVAVYLVGRAAFLRQPLPWRRPLVALVALALTLAYGAFRIHEVEARVASAPKATVGLVQVNMDVFSKREDPATGRERHIADSLALEQEIHPDLIIWPESAFTYFIRGEVSNVKRPVMGDLATPLLFGGLSLRDVDGEERYFNTAFITDADGHVESTYDKTFLLAFAEYLPLSETLPVLHDISPRSGHFTKGTHQRAMTFGDFRISTLICYEDILPSFVLSAVREANPHLLVNITNDAWFGDTNEPWIHLALAKFRAVEHHRYLIRSTNSGVSAIVDPVGRVTAHTEVFERARLHGEVAMLATPSIYEAVGNWPGWLGLLMTAFLCVRRRVPGGRSVAGDAS